MSGYTWPDPLSGGESKEDEAAEAATAASRWSLDVPFEADVNFVHLDVVIHAHTRLALLRVPEAQRRQRLMRQPIQLLEQTSPTALDLLKGPLV